MGIYGNFLLPRLIHVAMRHPVARERRGALVPAATGAVLEIGIGSGLNLPHYSASATSICGLDPSVPLLAIARRYRGQAPSSAMLVCGSAESLPFPDRHFDSLVMTWTLCSVPNPEVALAEMRRVLKPGGQLLFVEHGLAPDESVQRWQKRFTPAWKCVAGGCHLDRPMDRLIQSAGFRLESLDARYLARPRILGFFYEGRAVAV